MPGGKVSDAPHFFHLKKNAVYDPLNWFSGSLLGCDPQFKKYCLAQPFYLKCSFSSILLYLISSNFQLSKPKFSEGRNLSRDVYVVSGKAKGQTQVCMTPELISPLMSLSLALCLGAFLFVPQDVWPRWQLSLPGIIKCYITQSWVGSH